MPDDSKEPAGYAFEPIDFEKLRKICKMLFGDGSRLSADQRRDLANEMHLILERAIKID